MVKFLFDIFLILFNLTLSIIIRSGDFRRGIIGRVTNLCVATQTYRTALFGSSFLPVGVCVAYTGGVKNRITVHTIAKHARTLNSKINILT